MGQTLTNGIYLPAEGERNCYEGLAANWTALDGMIGGYNVHIGNTAIHVTAEDKATWNGKADASALTAHTGDTTIHVTAEDKATWNGKADASALTAHTGDTTIHVTAADKAKWDAVTGKANDTDAVHKSGAETIVGQKTFVDYSFASSGYGFIGQGNRTSYILPEFTGGYSGLSIVTPDFNKSVKIGTWTTDENTGKKVLNTLTGYLQISTGGLNGVNTVGVTPVGAVNSNLGTESNKWKTFNGSTPSSLGMPDLNNAVDISGYITDLAGSPNIYSPPANGYIVLRSTTANVLGIVENTTGMGSYSRGSNQVLAVYLPVVKNSGISIYAICSSLTQAKFIPCQGNV